MEFHLRSFRICLIQGIDFNHLYNNYGCRVQIGGSDQWGNITTGLEVIRKTHEEEAKAFGITIPLVTKADGTKFGKSAGGLFGSMLKKHHRMNFTSSGLIQRMQM